jgi:glycosyltransferase involved in cell wall biosynthesis
MRILVLTNHYPPHGYGGYELCCRDVVDRLAARGHEVAVLTSDHRVTPAGPAVAPGGSPEAAVARALPLTWDHGTPPARWRRPAVERRARRTLAGAIATHRPDVISAWNMSGLPGTLLTTLATGRVPVVWVLADAWPDRVLLGDPWLAPLARHPAAARVVGRATRLPTGIPDLGRSGTLCFCSAHLRDRVASSSGWAVAGSPVTPLGVDRGDFPDSGPREASSWSGRLLYVGRLDPGKGIDTLVRALAELPDAFLRVVGPAEARHRERLSGLTRSLGVAERVEFGTSARRDLPDVYRWADVCVFPSEWDEPFGIVPLEAMACGTPVVATGRGGSAEFLRDGENCVCFAAGDASALAAAVRRTATDPDLRRRLIEGGRRTADTLTVDRLADQLEGIHARAASPP